MSSTRNNPTKSSYAEQCVAIVNQFHQPQVPQTTSLFRRMLFNALHDAAMDPAGTILTKDDIYSMYCLMDILDDVDKANAQLCKEQ